MRLFPCPYLGGVELTAEREAHIAQMHPDLLRTMEEIARTLADPDQVRRSTRMGYGQAIFPLV